MYVAIVVAAAARNPRSELLTRGVSVHVSGVVKTPDLLVLVAPRDAVRVDAEEDVVAEGGRDCRLDGADAHVDGEGVVGEALVGGFVHGARLVAYFLAGHGESFGWGFGGSV